MGRRFAIYYVPPADTDIYRFGAGVLGYDCYAGAAVPYPDFAPEDWAALTREARTYGFHATLKAPFRLKPGVHEEDLARELSRLAQQPRALPVIAPEVTAIGGFVALKPREPSDALNDLAGQCVKHFDQFRATLTPDDLRRRRAAGLTQRQDGALQRWGYPFVFEEFQFHMTLTGSLHAERRPAIVQLLQQEFERHCGDLRLAVDRLALVRQDSPEAGFRVVAQAVVATDGQSNKT